MTAEGSTRLSFFKRLVPRSLGLRFYFCAAVVAGVLGGLGQQPYDQPVLLVVALAFAFLLWRRQPDRRAAGIIGWAFGAGYFALTLFWIVEPFQVDAERHGWMAPFALFFMSGGLALFWACAFWVARLLYPSAVALVLTWTTVEILRAYVLTGFPWVSPAQIAVDGPISRLLAWTGPHGTTLCLMILAWALSIPARTGARLSLRIGQGALFLAAALAFYLPLARPPAELTGHWVRLIQPNAAQRIKWHPDYTGFFFQRQLTMTAAPPAEPSEKPDLIVWPETAIPWRLGTAEPALTEIALAANGAEVALGVLRFEGPTLRNSLAVLNSQGAARAIYDKYHLVPFGEYVPFADYLSRVGLRAMVEQTSGFSGGPGPVLLDFGALGTALPLICYEAVFAHLVNGAPARPDFLLQVTNDAWFGNYAGPQQHLAQARMRAIEQGLPLLRSANTGISAVIDPFGRTITQLALNTDGFVDAPLPRPLPPTLYSKNGDLPVAFLLAAGFAVIFARRIRGGRSERY